MRLASSPWRMPSITAWPKSCGVVGSLAMAMRPVSSSTRATSVKVPPMSMPIRHAIRSSPAACGSSIGANHSSPPMPGTMRAPDGRPLRPASATAHTGWSMRQIPRPRFNHRRDLPPDAVLRHRLHGGRHRPGEGRRDLAAAHALPEGKPELDAGADRHLPRDAGRAVDRQAALRHALGLPAAVRLSATQLPAAGERRRDRGLPVDHPGSGASLDRVRAAADRDRHGHLEHRVRRAAGGERTEAQRERERSSTSSGSGSTSR